MALVLSEVLGDIANQSYSLKMLVRLKIKEGKIQEAISYYFSGIAKWEEMRGYLRDNDEFI